MEAEQKTQDIHAGHRQRMLENYLSGGMDGFSDVEVLEFLLSYSLSRRDVNPLAHRLLEEFGDLHGVFAAPIAQLRQVSGVGPRTAALLRFVSELWNRCEANRTAKERFLRNTAEIGQYLLARNSGRREERAWLLALDARCRVVGFRELCRGAVNSVNLPYRKVVEAALLSNATTVILAHNHTNGSVLPSREDIEYTRGLKYTLSLVDVFLSDHFILCERSYLSMKASNMLD
jgi:DNA repair protein RadC